LEQKGYLRRDTNRPRAVGMLVNPPTLPGGDLDARAREAGTVYVPIVGQIAAGTPILAEESIEDVFPLPRELVGEGEHFLLKVRGDSMIDAAITNGDWVVIRSQNDAENGEIVAAMIGDEATVKTLRRRRGEVWLDPANPNYEPIDGHDATIVGRVVSVLRRIK
jgi:repressor LexA